MKEIYPEDIRFSLEKAKETVLDLFAYAFNCPRDARSEEYKSGFRAGAFNSLILPKHKHVSIKPHYPKGSCQLDAYFSGYEEGRTAACSFQINYIDSFQQNETFSSERPEEGSSDKDVVISFI